MDSRSASSSRPPTGARTCSSASARSSSRRGRGRDAGLRSTPDIGTLPSGSLDRHDRTALRVELVEVLRDAESLAALVSPARQPLVQDRPPAAGFVRDTCDAQDVAPERVHAAVGIGGADVRRPVREAVGLELRPHVPRPDARDGAVAPDPAAVEIARLGSDADATQVRVVADVDREPAPHTWPAPAARSPRLVAVAARLGELVAHAVGLDPAAPPPRLLEVTLADVLPRLGARTRPGSSLPVAADRWSERPELHVHDQACRPRPALGPGARDIGSPAARERPPPHGREPLVAHPRAPETPAGHPPPGRAAAPTRHPGPG